MKIRDFLEKGGKTIDLDWDRERGFIATEDKDKAGQASKTPKATFNLKQLYIAFFLQFKNIQTQEFLIVSFASKTSRQQKGLQALGCLITRGAPTLKRKLWQKKTN